VTDEERIESGGRKMLPQFLLSPLKVHYWKVYQETKGGLRFRVQLSSMSSVPSVVKGL
jgi:hypothetical protein